MHARAPRNTLGRRTSFVILENSSPRDSQILKNWFVYEGDGGGAPRRSCTQRVVLVVTVRGVLWWCWWCSCSWRLWWLMP